ncbi:zona pellucida-like domain protein [Ancylostoma ceylanicum]|uniref:Zona pellucida-like domain protein n=1 Tax=Ancylostoma ceylanicum TaxID=53326 RepID=A0A0D6LAI1_9BILA|nr:zona pellucida-like domain protein [Ancylostoma ceylanicum]
MSTERTVSTAASWKFFPKNCPRFQDNPAGIIQRVCISVQLHPLFVTEADRSYCAQCVYVQSRVLDDLESSLDISEALPTELAPTFDVDKIPKCTYTIRKGSESGPEVRYATVGESVYHVWNCPGENTGILVQNCYVEDGQGNRILVIDQNGCGVDQYVMPTPEYSADLTTAFQETHVFKFAQKTITRFICQIRICLQSDECKKLSPPSTCPTLEERLQQAKVERDTKQEDVKQLMKPDESDYDSPRSRRELSQPRVSTAKGYPEVGLVGELRVLDSPEDVMYFGKSNAIQTECVSKVAYSLVVAALVIVSVLFIIMVLVIIARASSYRNKIIRFEN